MTDYNNQPIPGSGKRRSLGMPTEAQKQAAIRAEKNFAAAMAVRRKKQALDDLVKDIESTLIVDERLARNKLATIAKAINAKLRPHGFTVKIELARKGGLNAAGRS